MTSASMTASRWFIIWRRSSTPKTAAPTSSSMVVKRRHMPMVAIAGSGSMVPATAREAVSMIMPTTTTWVKAPDRRFPPVSHHRARTAARAPSSKAARSRP